MRHGSDILKDIIDGIPDHDAMQNSVWIDQHKADMRRFIDKYGCNQIAVGQDGLLRPTDVPVPRGNGICDADFVDTGTLK